MKKSYRGLTLYLLLLIMLFVGVMSLANSQKINQETYGYANFIKDLEEENIREINGTKKLDSSAGTVSVTLNNGEEKSFDVPDINQFEEYVAEVDRYYDRIYTLESPKWYLTTLPFILSIGAMIFLFMFIMNQAQGGGGGSRVMNFGKSKAKMMVDNDKKITFKNVAGLDEEKEELQEIVEFLKNSRKYVELGARIPKGVLLEGPPGTGKTLLAKAVAGEAGVPFFSISGSDFVEMFVGVGASRVRDLFEQAKKNSPCIVFIDEIDAVGRKRGAGLGGGHDEREQTLNQLLVEMDGFGVNEGIIVISATNRVDILDPALLRPGRFDRKVLVGRPDVKGREEILNIHSKGKPLSDDVNLKDIAKITFGFTGADLENVLNEAALLSAREDKKVISQKFIQKAIIKIAVGTEKKSRVVSEKDNKITAYHEAGHAIIMHLLDEVGPVNMISIIPVGQAGGWTMPLPQGDESYKTKEKIINEIVVSLGGRAAEEIIFNQITTGAYSDIKSVTSNATNLVTQYGMSEKLGPINFSDDSNDVFIGRDWGHTRKYGENIATIIDAEIKNIVDDAYEQAKEVLKENIDKLHKTAELLLEKEKINRQEFEAIFDENNNENIDEQDSKEEPIELEEIKESIQAEEEIDSKEAVELENTTDEDSNE